MEYKNDIVGIKPEKPEGCKNCDKECNVYTSVTMPVEFDPECKVGRIEAMCCGDPEVKNDCTHEGNLRVTIKQNLVIKVPVCYDVKVKVGKSQANCRGERE